MEDRPEIHLSDYLYIIRKRQWVIVSCVVLALVAVLCVNSRMMPVYKAISRVVIEKTSTSSPVTGERTENEGVKSQLLSFNTHLRLMKSYPVMEQLLKKLKADNKQGADSTELEEISLKSVANQEDVGGPNKAWSVSREYLKKARQRFKENVSLLLNLNDKTFTGQKLWDLEVRQLQNKVRIFNTKDTRLLNIAVEDSDPKMAATIANGLAKTYIEFDMASRLESSNENLAWLNKEVYAMKQRLEEDEAKFYEFKQENKVFSLSGKQKVIDQKIYDLNNKYLAARDKRQELDTKLEEISNQYASSSDIRYVRSILDNKSIDNIYSNLTNLELELGRLSKVFLFKHPKMQQVTAELTKVRAKLKAELSKEIKSLKVQRNMLAKREKEMEQTISEFEADAMDASAKEFNYTILQRNMDTSQKLYETMVAKMKETGILTSSTSSNIRIVEKAPDPLSPIRPKKRKNMLVCLAIGLFVGVGMTFFLEYLDQTINNEDDVESYLGVPLLSIIPEVADKKRIL